MKEAGDEEDEKHCSRGCQLQTPELFWCVPGPKTRPMASTVEIRGRDTMDVTVPVSATMVGTDMSRDAQMDIRRRW